jgi:hypothetical protein
MISTKQRTIALSFIAIAETRIYSGCNTGHKPMGLDEFIRKHRSAFE